VIVIPTAVIMYSGIAFLAFSWVPLLSTALAFVLEKSIALMNRLLTFIENAPFASISKIWLSIPEYLLLYTIIIGLFYFLYHKKTWLLLCSAFCLLLFCTSISIKKYNADKTCIIAFLNLHKNTGIVFKNGNRAVVLSNLADTDRNYRYSVQPYLDSSQVSNVSVININQDVDFPYIKKQGALVQFLNKRIVIFDKHLQNQLLTQKLKTDYIYITGNPHTSPQRMMENFNLQTVVVDGSNSDQTIARIAGGLNGRDINFVSLKRNISFITISN
ncbi:MAG TPA: hypothetical protein VIM77_12935, partial [Mucilaginibacter sp.]